MYKIDLSPATYYGELTFVLEDGDLRNHDWSHNLRLIKERLSVFQDGDYLLMIGSPVAMVMAAMVASQRVDELHILYWLRQERSYIEVAVDTEVYSITGEQDEHRVEANQ